MNNKNEVFEYLIDQLRQQLTNNPYKQQCEDLAHEVLSLKNKLRDSSALVAELQKEITKLNGELRHESEQAKAYRSEALRFQSQVEDLVSRNVGLQETIKLMNEDFDRVTGRGGPLPPGTSYVVGEHGPEQSGCRKEDTQECEHDWVLDEKGDYFVCAKCGKQEAELSDCQHANTVGLRKGFAPGFTKKCLDCGAKIR